MASYARFEAKEVISWLSNLHKKVGIEAMQATLDDVDKMFNSTVSTWKVKPTFEQDPIKVTQTAITSAEGTDDEKYVRINDGTPARIILAKDKPMSFYPGFTPKTRPRKLVATGGGGSGGKRIARWAVGTVKKHAIEARKFDETIAPIAEKRLVINFEKAWDRNTK